MESWVSVPIESCQLQRLIEQLGRRGGAADLNQALADAIELWLAEQSKVRIGGNPCAVHGYQWKSVFLPDGTQLRTVSYRDEQCARVQGSEIIFNGRGTRNAWNDIYVRRPQDKFYILASRLRRLVRQEQEQANCRSLPADSVAAESVAAQSHFPESSSVCTGSDNLANASSAVPPASNVLAELVSACAAVLQRTIPPPAAHAFQAADPVPRDCGKGEGWDLPERRKFRFRLEDLAFS